MHSPAAVWGDLAHLLDVEVHQLTRRAALVAAYHPAGGPVDPRQAVRPLRLRTRQIVAAGTPVRADRYTGPCRVLRRRRQIRSSTLAAVRRGDRRGREDRSTSPASPSSHQRRNTTSPPCPATGPSGGPHEPGASPTRSAGPSTAAQRA